MLEFLLLNPTFPQSVRFSLAAAWNSLESISRATADSAGPPVRALGLLHARLVELPVGHCPHVEATPEFVRALDQFLPSS